MAYPAKTNPEAILAAAIDLLEREGEAALTLRRLAGELGLVPNALYRYYASREVLVAAVADAVARRLIAAITAELERREATAGPRGSTPVERARALAEVYAVFAEAHPALYETLTADRREAEAALPKPLGHDLLWQLVMGTLEPLVGRERAPDVAIALWGLLHGLWALRRAGLLGGVKPDAPTGFAIDALLAGWSRAPPWAPAPE